MNSTNDNPNPDERSDDEIFQQYSGDAFPDGGMVEEPQVFITPNDLYNINEEVTGMIPFVRDRHLLLSAVRRPFISLFGQAQFPTLLEKAAALMHSLAYHHLFADGNKRTANRATRLFLEANHITPNWTDEEGYAFMLHIARGDTDVPEIVTWLEANTEAKS